MPREKSKGPSQRQLQVGELVRHALAEIFSRGELMDEMIERHPVTVPEVRMTPDLKLATCFVMPLGGEDAAEVVKQLGKHARYLRGEVARRVKLRYAPELRFRLDTSFDVSQRIDALLASPQVARDVSGDDD